MSSEAASVPPISRRAGGTLIGFFLILLLIALLRIVIGLLALPDNHNLILWASVGVTVVFVAAPILGLFWAAGYAWTPIKAVIMLIGGGIVWAGSMVLAQRTGNPLVGGSLVAISQSGLICWCFALGSLLALLIKDKNLILPIAVFLALFDMWLVFAPEGVVQHFVVQGPMTQLKTMAYQSPSVATASAGGRAEPMLYIGPADFVFLSMFFVALYRFRMRVASTLRVIMPVLALYLIVVLCWPGVHIGPITLGALPALLPIGLVVLIVNRDQFNLNRDEKITTVVLAVLGTALVIWRIGQPPPPPRVETWRSGRGQGGSGPPRLPGQASPGQPPKAAQSVPGNTPNPP
jgi:hypothetical protein